MIASRFNRSGKACVLAGALIAFFAAALTSASAADADIAVAISEAGVDPQTATMVILRRSDERRWVANRSRAGRRYVPASTSKIPHTLIALETGVAAPDGLFAWDGAKRWSPAWNRDLTLAEAFSVSAVWVYQRIAAELGAEAMADWLARFDYGGGNTGGEGDSTTYWLNGPLSISADEQVDFLERLAAGALPVTDATLAAARTIMVADRGPDWTLFAKTGWGLRGGDLGIGWYVGWVERDDEVFVFVFAFNMDMAGMVDAPKRAGAARAALRTVGAIGPAAD